MIVGFLIQWPTLLTVIMAPALIPAYRRLSLAEEREVRRQYGARYEDYAAGWPRGILVGAIHREV